MEVWQCSKCHGYTPGFIRFCKTCGKEYCYETDPFSLTSEFVSENDVKEIAECYGLEHQLHILQEELAELIQAASKYCRYHDKKAEQSLVEEVGDTYIMLAQIEYLMSQHDKDFCSKIHTLVTSKIYQQLDRIKKDLKP